MAVGEKYIALTAYLEKCGQSSIRMTFKEIEKVLGESLPDSAYKHPALWSNSRSHSIAFGWMDAGYATQNVNLIKQTVEFVKSDSMSKTAAVKTKDG